MSGIAQTFGDVRSTLVVGLLGAWAALSHLNKYATAWNASPQAAEVTTVTVTTTSGTAGQIHTLTLSGGETVSYTTTGSEASTAAIAAAFADAINQEPLVRGRATASVASAVITLTGNYPGDALGVAFTASGVSGAAASLSTTTAADDADPIAFARAIIDKGRDTGGEKLCALAASSAFTAQADTWDLTYDAGAVVNVAIFRVDGEGKTLIADISHAMASDLNTSVDAIVTELNAALPANSVIASNVSDDLVLTAEVAGLEFETVISAETASVAPARTAGGASRLTSFVRAFLGFSLESSNDPATTIGGTTASYAGNAGVRYAIKGPVYAASTEASAGDSVFVELGSGDDTGKFFATASSTRVALSRSVARWDSDAADGLAVLHLDL